MMLYVLATFILLQNVHVTLQEEEDNLLDVVYWEVKPYIFTNKDGELDGIIPKMLEEAQYYCMSNTSILAKYTLKANSRKSFYDLARSETENYGQGQLSNVSVEKAFWAPVLANKVKGSKEFEKRKGIKSFQLIKSDQIAVIVPRHLISLPNKILRGVLSCSQIFLLALLLASFTAMMIWSLERFKNDDFSSSFLEGTGTGLWWSIVSMTTVGYGDIVPRSTAGRFLGVIWLIVGVMIACVMTATMADVVAGVDDLGVQGKRVAVLENSYDAKVASYDYGAEAVLAKSYEDVIQLVRDNEVFGAMINADVAAWYQDEILNDDLKNPLRIVDLLPANLYVNCYVPATIGQELRNVFKCMYQQKEEVYSTSIEGYKRYCQKEVLYIGSSTDFIKDNKFVQVLLWIVIGMFIVGCAHEAIIYWFRSRNQEDLKEKAEFI